MRKKYKILRSTFLKIDDEEQIKNEEFPQVWGPILMVMIGQRANLFPMYRFRREIKRRKKSCK
jgi:hypothetical protein